MYWDMDNLYAYIPADGFKWRNNDFGFDEQFMKNYHDDRNKGHT